MVQAFYLSGISLNAEQLQTCENLKEFLSALSFEAGFKVYEQAALQMTEVCKI